MLVLAVLGILVGLGLIISGVARGELSDQRPSEPEPHWRTTIGAMVFVGGALVTVATIAVPRLVQQQETADAHQPVGPSGSIAPVSTRPGTFR